MFKLIHLGVQLSPPAHMNIKAIQKIHYMKYVSLFGDPASLRKADKKTCV